jgi:hypothetical protein
LEQQGSLTLFLLLAFLFDLIQMRIEDDSLKKAGEQKREKGIR